MGTQRFDRLECLFRAALLHEPADRAAFLAAACADDPELRRELEELLHADRMAESGGFLKQGISALQSQLLDEQDAASADMEGRRAGPYELVRRLGAGGMGEVYLARREQPFKQYVALKIIRRGMDSPEVVARFAAERQILAALNHPNIARLLDGGVTDDGLSYLAMEYVDGSPITDFCDERHLTVLERLQLFRTACDAVHYAHQNLIIHRDLKPSNILVTGAGTVKLLDFGIAKLLNPNLSPVAVPVTRTAFRVMTPEYASPEQLLGEHLSTAADVYSLGVILYELLAGCRPHRAAGRPTHVFVAAVCDQEPERPSTRLAGPTIVLDADGTETEVTPEEVSAGRGVPVERLRRQIRGDLDNITLMALRKEPGRRYRSAQQLKQDVDRFLSGMPVQARPYTVRYRARKFAARHRVGVVAAVLVLLSLVGGLSAALWQAREASRERGRAELALDRSETITNFLMELFEANDPRATKGSDVTARELLERGVARADALGDQPELQAHLLDVVGRVHESLGQYDHAEALLDRALYLRRRTLGEQHPTTAASMTHLGRVLTHRGRYEEAETLLRGALAIEQDGSEPPDLQLAATYHQLAFLLPYMGRWTEAEQAYRRALEIRTQLLGGEHPDVAYTMVQLGAVLRSQGRYQEAEAAVRGALDVYRRTQGEEHPYVTGSMFQLAILLRQKGALDEEESVLRRAIELRRRLEGESDPEVSSYLFELGEVLHEKGRSTEAESVLREALDIRRSVLGAHPATADGVLFLASFLHDRGQLEEADSRFREALAMRRELFGAEHQEVAVAMRYLARLQIDRRRYAEAESLITAAQAIHLRANGPDHHHTAEALADLGQLRERTGRQKEAAALYRDALAILRKSHREEHVKVQEIRARIARLAEEMERVEDAEADLAPVHASEQ